MDEFVQSSTPQADQDNWMRFDGDSSEPYWTEDDLDEDANELDISSTQ